MHQVVVHLLLFPAFQLESLVVLVQVILPLVVAGEEVVMCQLLRLAPLRWWQEQANLQEEE
jgi:hypothetical protein